MDKTKQNPLNRLLLGILIVLLVIVAVFSLKALVFTPTEEKDPVPVEVRENARRPIDDMQKGSSSLKTFAGLGRIRASLKPEGNRITPETVVIEPYFPYDSADRAFSEELASHIHDFRSVTGDFFSALPSSSFLLKDEESLKNELLKRYNSFLHLGKIETLYFTDFMILD
ncbi:MAG: hypothetical protein LBV68_03180 [Spirochaetaceae bacterium]|jgi:flagellar basal body-associated protein FliL|nr:hypothetical protein [Spirochaetaceae bacterium]